VLIVIGIFTLLESTENYELGNILSY
jgi:hypothetical protein